MSIIKKMLACVSSLAIAVSITACADTSWANKIDGTEIDAGVYIFYALEGYNEASTKLSETEYTGSIFDQKIEEKDVDTYVSDYATDRCKKTIAIDKKFDELGLTLSENDEKAIAVKVQSALDNAEDYYTKHGVSTKSLTRVVTTLTKQDLIFDKYYAEGGIEAVSQEDINAQLIKDYARIKPLRIALAKADGSEVDDARKTEVLNKANDYIKRVEDGENFDDIITEYYQEISPVTDDSSSETDVAEEDIDPYKNEIVVYDGYQYMEADTITEILALNKYDEPTLIKTDDYYYVVEKLDILEREDITSDLISNVLLTLKFDDFEAMIESLSADYSVEINKDSYDRYSIQEILKKDK